MAVSDKLLNPVIEKRLELVVHNRGIKNVKISITPAVVENPNMLGLIWEVRVIGKDASNAEVEYNWILKSATLSEVVRKYAQIDRLFKKEIFIYEKVIPAYKQLAREFGVWEQFAVVPQVHQYFTDTYQECLLFEDLRRDGFATVKSAEPCSYGHASLAMKALGKLHALSFALREHKPEEYKKLTEYAKNRFNVSTNIELYSKHQKICCERVLETLKSSRDRSIVALFKKFMEKSYDYQTQAIKMGAMGPYAVLTHGDAVLDNMLFKYGDPSRPTMPTEISLLDWQYCRFGSPALDLSQFLFMATDRQFREKHFTDMIRIYYYALCTYLTELNCDADKILPYDILQLQLKRYSVYGLCMAIIGLHIVMSDVPTKQNAWTGNVKEEDIQAAFGKSPTNSAYNTRIRDVVLDYQNYGYFEFLN